MVTWVVTASKDFPVYRYVVSVLQEEEKEDDPELRRWLVEASEGLVVQLMKKPEVVSVGAFDTW